MIVIAVICAILIGLLLLRFGISVEYGELGFIADAQIGPIKKRLYPISDKKRQRPARKLIRKATRQKKRAKKEPEKTGLLESFNIIFPAIISALDRLRRKLLIKKLTIRYSSADADPSKAALTYGTVNAFFAIIRPWVIKRFRVKSCDLSASVDFESVRPRIHFIVKISLAVWEAVYITLAVLPAVSQLNSSRKDEQKNGKAPDK